MPMTETEIAKINRRAMTLNGGQAQNLIEAIRYGSRGEASTVPRTINPNSARRIPHLRFLGSSEGNWVDLSGETGAKGRDLVSMIVWLADIDDEPDACERAALALERYLDSMPEAAPTMDEILSACRAGLHGTPATGRPIAPVAQNTRSRG